MLVAAGGVGALLRAAAQGDQESWQALVDRYSAAIVAVTRAYRLGPADAGDVLQTTWLRLLEHRDRIRDPEKLGAWLLTTARHECQRIQRHARRLVLAGDHLDNVARWNETATSSIEDNLLVAERNAAVKEAVGALPVHHRSLIELLMADPAPSYQEVSAILRIPIGSIGPTRGRCLARLRTRLQVS